MKIIITAILIPLLVVTVVFAVDTDPDSRPVVIVTLGDSRNDGSGSEA